MKIPKPKDVDAYIAMCAKEAIPVLEEIRQVLLSSTPKLEEGISWSVPFYKYHGPIAGFAIYKKHVSFGIANGNLEAKDREILEKKGYTTGTKTIQIKFDQKVPSALIKQLLKTQIKINADKIK